MSSSYTLPVEFEPSRSAALAAVARVNPDLYGRTRNFLDGAVTYLSPWVTHGFVGLNEATQQIARKHKLSFDDKIVFEFAWREFFKHVHGELGDGILRDIRKPAWPGRYATELPADISHGRTGVAAIDQGVHMLYETGYIHNHVRMWIASYVVHIRKVNWRTGADWMYAHLLDGDLASNHLSWQWVASTFSHKPYVFNADNVHKFARAWNCRGTAIDTSYEDLESIARGKRDMGAEPRAPHVGIEPPLTAGLELPRLIELLGQRVPIVDWSGGVEAVSGQTSHLKPGQAVDLIHPWDLKRCWLGTGLKVGLLDAAFHRQFQWSEQRWQFALKAMAEHCDAVWVFDSGRTALVRQVGQHLKTQGLTFTMTETLNPGYRDLPAGLGTKTLPDERLLPNPGRFQQSFSRFYREATALAGSLDELINPLVEVS